jgi:hypothetical protein
MKRVRFLAALAAVAAVVPDGTAAQRAPQQLEPPAKVFLRPLASLLLPGSGQLMAHQDRGAVYLAAEAYLLSRFFQLDHEAVTEAHQFHNLAFDVARQSFGPTQRDTIFEYYEQMERFIESGAYDAGPGPAFVPESDSSTYNGSVWLLARRTFWADPNVPPDPTSPQYLRALQFYQARAIGPNFLYSWRNHSLEHEVFKDFIRRSDNAFRNAQTQVGLLLANHVLSAVDALISARMSAASARGASIRTTVTPRVAEIRFVFEF